MKHMEVHDIHAGADTLSTRVPVLLSLPTQNTAVLEYAMYSDCYLALSLACHCGFNVPVLTKVRSFVGEPPTDEINVVHSKIVPRRSIACLSESLFSRAFFNLN